MNKRLVLVNWTDANTGSEDVVTKDNIDSLHKPTIVHTLGWAMKEDDVGITVCTEYYDEAFRGRTFIPRICINSVTDHRLTKPPKPRKPKSQSHDILRTRIPTPDSHSTEKSPE